MLGERFGDQRCMFAWKGWPRHQPIITKTIKRSKVSGAERLKSILSISEAMQILFTEQHKLDLTAGEEARKTPGMGRPRDAGAALRQFESQQLRNPLTEAISWRIRLVSTDQ